MNIVYIDHYAGSDKYGMEFRPLYMAREWAKMGHKTVIIAADYSHLRRENPVIDSEIGYETIDQIEFMFIKTRRYKGNGVKRTLNMRDFTKALSRHAADIEKKYSPDAVIASSTYPMDVYPAKKIADAAGAALFYEIHDLWPLSLQVIGNLSERNPVIRFVQRAEDFCYKNCNAVISVLPNAIEHIKERGYEIPFYYVPNGIFANEANPQTALPEEYDRLLQRLHNEKRFVLMYVGGFAFANALETLVRSVPEMPAEIAVVMVGSGMEKPHIEALAAELAPEKIFILPPVTKDVVPALLHRADCLYMGLNSSPLYHYGIGMNKVADYMLSGRPVIYSVDAFNNPVRDVGGGITVAPSDPGAVALAAGQMLALSAGERERMGNANRRYVTENLDYPHLAGEFMSALKKEVSLHENKR